MELVKRLKINRFTLEHHRYVDSSGFYVESFNFIEILKTGEELHKPFIAPIKVSKYLKGGVGNHPTYYTDKEYEDIMQEQLDKHINNK